MRPKRRIRDSDSDESPERRSALAHGRFHNERADPVHDEYSPNKMLAAAAAREQEDDEMRGRIAQETDEMMDNGVRIDPRLQAFFGGRESLQPQPKDEPLPLLPADLSESLRVPATENLYEADEEMQSPDEEEQEDAEQEEHDPEVEAAASDDGAASDDSMSLSGVHAVAQCSAPRRGQRGIQAQADAGALGLYEEDEEDAEDEEDEEVEVPLARAPKTERKQGKRDWKTLQGGYMVEEATKDTLLRQYTSTFIGTVAHLKPGPWKPNQAGQFAKPVGDIRYRRRVHTCPFAKQAGCTVLVRESHTSTGQWVLEECGGPHADHSLVVNEPARGAPLALKVVALSPSKMNLPPSKALEAVRDEIGVVYEGEQRQLVRARHHQKKKTESAIIPAGARGKFAGVHHFCKAFTKAAIDDFGLHSVYVIGEPKIDSAKQIINIAMSTARTSCSTSTGRSRPACRASSRWTPR